MRLFLETQITLSILNKRNENWNASLDLVQILIVLT